jgi:hypothetical protein
MKPHVLAAMKERQIHIITVAKIDSVIVVFGLTWKLDAYFPLAPFSLSWLASHHPNGAIGTNHSA